MVNKPREMGRMKPTALLCSTLMMLTDAIKHSY